MWLQLSRVQAPSVTPLRRRAEPSACETSQGDVSLARFVLFRDSLEVMAGSLPRRALMLLVEWALAHRAELTENWERAERGEPIVPIEPLE